MGLRQPLVWLAVLILIVGGAIILGRTGRPIPPASPAPGLQTVLILTNKGDITLELYPNDAPKTVRNFTELARRGYYNGLTFHRVEPGFVVQGGDPKGDGTGGESIYGPTFEDELNPKAASYQNGYRQGVVAMANRGPNTNGSQFFILLADHPELPKNYTIFGRVTAGQDTVSRLVKGDRMNTVTVKE